MAAVVALVPAPVSGAVDDHFGREVKSLRIEGVGDEIRGTLRGGLELTPRRGFLRVDHTRLDRGVLQRDIDRIELYLARHGRPYATVTAEGTPTGDDGVALRLRIDPGPEVRFGAVEVESWPEGYDRPQLPIAEGERFVDAEVTVARRALEEELRSLGFARATVDRSITVQDSTRVTVRFDVAEAERFRFDGLVIEGSGPQLRELARRSIEDPVGETFSPVTLEHARRDLRELGLFRQVRVRADESGTDTLDLVVRLTERDMRTLGFGIGTWTDHPIQLTAEWRHRDLFGGGRGFRIDGSYALNLRELSAATNWPVLIARRSESTLGTRLRIEDEDSYWSQEIEVYLDHLFRVGQRTSWRVGTSWTTTTLDIRTEDRDAFETRPGQQVLFDVRWFHDGVDDLLDPNDGRRLRAEGEIAPAFPFADATFASLRGSWVEVESLAEGTILATRLDLATAWPIGGAVDLLPTQRWYGGGFNTHRGAPRRGLGPTDADDDPIGGQWRALAGVELRQDLNDWLGAVFFVDTGQVWATTDRVGVEDVVVAVGTGPMFRTPIGPIHLDFAWNVGERPADGSNWVFNFGIGHAY